jgi:hypothetical protein
MACQNYVHALPELRAGKDSAGKAIRSSLFAGPSQMVEFHEIFY